MSFGGFAGFGANNNQNQQQQQPQQQTSGFGGFGATNTNTTGGETLDHSTEQMRRHGRNQADSCTPFTQVSALQPTLALAPIPAALAVACLGATLLAHLHPEVRFACCLALNHELGKTRFTALLSLGQIRLAHVQTVTVNRASRLNVASSVICLFIASSTCSPQANLDFTAFGANNANSSPFGAKPAFGAPASTAGGGMFGSTNTASTGTGAFGGFGANSNTNSNTSAPGGFGSSTNTGGGMFGSQNKPAFGAGASTGGSLFGGGATSGGFGTSSTGGFGNTSGSTFGAQPAQAQTQNQGTAATPFSAYTEKDTGTNTNSHYQSITFQQPYQNFSFEELRAADYNAGRRYGNSNGQAGAFGTSTGFGGFGQTPSANTGATGAFGSAPSTTGGGMFGAQNQTQQSSTPAFGQQPASTGFGAGGGLFGNKPAAGNLFGSTPAASGQQTGGLFGTSSGTGTGGFGGGFGNTNTTAPNSNNSTGGLFGNTQSQTQNKPAFGGFGSGTQQPAAGGGLFGGTTPANTNPFGGTQPQQQQQSGGGLFGGFGNNQNQTQNQPQNQTQSTTGGGLFGGFGNNQNQAQQQKPAGLFGGSTGTTGGSLFGGNSQPQQQQQTSGSLFGGNANNNNNQQAGSLFGAKPATGGSLFGGTASNTGAAGGGLFGGTQNQQSSTPSLFGGNNQQQQQKPSLFGGSTANTGGSSLFGGLNQNNQSTQQQQPQNGSLFGGSQNNMQQSQQTPMTASLLQNPYGNDQLFANLGTQSPPVGPLATPLAGAQRPAKRPSMLPAFKINPGASMRLITPQKRANGYGFQYSNYGTPGSAQSFSSSRGNSLLGASSMNRSLSKSFSTSNLRNTLNPEDSVLAPGAFTPNPRPYSSGSSIRKLKIDRTLRTDLFGTDGPSDLAGRPSKRVSFDATSASGNKDKETNGESSSSNALVRTDSDGPEPTPEELGLLRAPRPSSNGARNNGAHEKPEMEQARGDELAVVPENEQAPATEPRANRKGPRKSMTDQEPGDYYMIPSIEELRDMARDQLRAVHAFEVGRIGVGKIEFDEVDLTTVALDQIIGEIVKLNIRSATVYETGVNTPPMGKGLNVPSTITLENSWPRSNGGRLPVHERKGTRYEKHVERLRRVGGTEFISYDAESGEWVFRVQHFTTYELDDDDDETMLETSGLSPPPDSPSPTPKAATPFAHTTSQDESSIMSPENSDPDDTFDFMKGSRTAVPGGFGDQSIYEDEDMAEHADESDEESDIDNSRTSALEDPFNEKNDDAKLALMSPPETDNEAEMAGSYPDPSTNSNGFGASFLGSFMPKSILKAPQPVGTPLKKGLELDNDWAAQLQRTVSPKKQDRQALRERQSVAMQEDSTTAKASALGASFAANAFTSTMDIMNSLWAQPSNASTKNTQQTAVGGKGFEV